LGGGLQFTANQSVDDTDKLNSTHSLKKVKEVKQTQNTAEQNYPGSVSLL